MTAKPTDDAVARLPIGSGRAELLEAIVATPAGARTSARRARWLAPLAVAAVVALILGLVSWGRGPARPGTAAGSADQPSATQPTASDPVSPSPSTGSTATSESDERVLVTAPGWQVTSPGPDGGIYRNGKATLEITQAPASVYDDYVRDRKHIVDPPAPGTPLTVLGVQAQLWAYPDPDDFTVIRSVVDGRWMELRGQGLDEADFRALLGSLRLVSVAEFEQAMPARFVTADERGEWIKDALGGIEDATGVMFPHGALPDMTRATTGGDEDPYQLGVDVAGAYACAWLGDYQQATSSEDTAEAAEAVRVLGTSRQWPVLQDMKAEGDYSQVVWQYADEIAAGQSVEGYQNGLGC